MLENLLLGFQIMFQWSTFLFLCLGTMLGIIVGAIPGLSSPIAISLLLPFTYGMNPVVALGMCAGIYTGSTCGGSISAILLEVPGTGAAVVTAFDGYQMTKQGKAGLALGIAFISSAFGGAVAAIMLGTCSPFLAQQALNFGPPEYLMLAVMGFCSIIGMSSGRTSKNLFSIVLGLAISIIGISPQGGVMRFTFGISSLIEGLPLVPMLIGMFGINSILFAMSNIKFGETVTHTSEEKKAHVKNAKVRFPDKKLMKSILPVWLQSTVIGNIVGAIPGAGMQVAIFMAYDQVKRFKRKLKFGTGVPEGVAAAECANNSVVGSSMIPLLALGVPGNAVSALFLGALMIHGLRTGPNFFAESPQIAYPLIVAFLLASLLLIPLGTVFSNTLATQVLRMRKEVLNGLIMILCVTGAYATGNNYTYIMIACIFSVIAFVLKQFDVSFGSLILAVVLGEMVEQYYLQSRIVFKETGWFAITQRPIAFGLLILSVIFLLMPIWRNYRRKRDKRLAETEAEA